MYTFAEDASNNPTFYASLGNPQSLNKYQYAYNNPLRYVDPDGHDPLDPLQDPACPCTMTPAQADSLKRDVQSVLDKVADVTGISALADAIRNSAKDSANQTKTAVAVTEAVVAATVSAILPKNVDPNAIPALPPSPLVQPVPPPPITMGKGSTRDVRKINPGREAAGKKAVEDARAEVTRTKGVRNKTAADVEAYNAAKRALRHALDKLKKSETDARKGRGNR